MKTYWLALLGSVGLVSAEQNQKVCRVLSLSGGGSKGAYEIGVMESFVNMLPEAESYYDVISGVSVGSINALGFGTFGKGEEKQMVDEMMGLWKNLTNRQVWNYWDSPNPLHGLMYEQGLLSNEPLKETLSGILKEKNVKKKVVVSANEANTGKYLAFSLHEMKTKEEVVAAVLGSAGVPFVFPPQNMSKYGIDAILIDGGVTSWNNNLESGIEECLKMEGIKSKSQIEVDVIAMNPASISPYDFDAKTWMPSTIRYILRKREIKAYHSLEDDMIQFMRANPDVTYRYFVQPEQTLLPEYEILEFGIDYTGKVIEQGKVDAKVAVELGPGKSFDKLFNTHRVDKTQFLQ